jgi:PelA/Pel-15E family pectate lyase
MRGCCVAGLCLWAAAGWALERGEVEAGLRRAAGFFREQVSTEGGYLWKYSADLTLREGENVADDRAVWVQPPGTPSVGLAFLRAWRAAGDACYLEAAQAAGLCLVRGQLRSGGWPYMIPFDAQRREKLDLRVDAATRGKSVKRHSVLDDNTTQEALRFLVLLDEAQGFTNAPVHEAAQYGLAALLKAQFPNGAFPQVFFENPAYDPAAYPVKKAEYPPEGTAPTHEKDYHVFYTFNDGLMRDLNRLFFAAAEVYSNAAYRAAAEKAGGFMKLAQLPEPQPAWAQQYDFRMRPCWARKFEPPAVTGGESQSVIMALTELFLVTGDASYLEPLPRAVAYLKRSRLADGRLARFYELRTNTPLYFTKDYQLTASDADMPTHYAFKIDDRLDEGALAAYPAMSAGERQKELNRLRQKGYRALGPEGSGTQKAAEAVLKALDGQGRWVTQEEMKSAQGRRVSVVSCAVFVKNVATLCAYLEGSKGDRTAREAAPLQCP